MCKVSSSSLDSDRIAFLRRVARSLRSYRSRHLSRKRRRRTHKNLCFTLIRPDSTVSRRRADQRRQRPRLVQRLRVELPIPRHDRVSLPSPALIARADLRAHARHRHGPFERIDRLRALPRRSQRVIFRRRRRFSAAVESIEHARARRRASTPSRPARDAAHDLSHTHDTYRIADARLPRIVSYRKFSR